MPIANDWATFTLENPEFTGICYKLFRAIPELVSDSVFGDEDLLGRVISELTAVSVPDFDDILLLCSKDRFWGALKLLRTFFERTVTLKYLAQNPTEVDAFIGYDAIDWDAIISGIEKVSGLQPEYKIKQRIQEAAGEARKRYKQEPCKTCGLRKQTNWTPRSTLELAQKVGLEHLHFDAFLLPSKYIHPSYFGTRDQLGMSEAPLYNILKATHTLTVETVLTHQRHYKSDPLISPIVIESIQGFFRVWKFSETDFGFGDDAQRAGIVFRQFDRKT
jgi:hypothetical protein